MDLNSVNWRKSSYSASNGGDCVEVGLGWRRSSHSTGNSGNCVEAGVGWRGTSYSAGNSNCVEAGMDWRKSRHNGSNGGGCVEVARRVPAVVAVRDSKDPDGPVLAFSREDWQAFTARIKSGDLSPG